MNANLNAFLTLIRTGEGTLGPDGYRTLYGGDLFESFADHPRVKVKAGKWTSSAAGAYQFLAKTWDALVAQHPELNDFSPASQDAGAVYLIKGRSAYDDVIAGRFRSAILKCNKEWASLPLSPYGQPTLTMQTALLILANAGGVPVDESTPPPETPMIPLAASILVNALPSLIGALPEIANIFKKPDVAERNVEAVAKVGTILMQSTGATNMQEAVERVQADPQTASEANDALRMNRADILDLVERMAKLDEDSVAAARTFSAQDKPIVGRWLFVHVISLLFVLLGGGAAIYILATSKDATERAMALQALLLVGFASVAGFWLGSSRSSQVKDLVRDK